MVSFGLRNQFELGLNLSDDWDGVIRFMSAIFCSYPSYNQFVSADQWPFNWAVYCVIFITSKAFKVTHFFSMLFKLSMSHTLS